jgi:hypothetical protein
MRIPLDKIFHFLAGWVIAATFQSMPLIAAALVVTAAVGKEIWDKRSGKGTPDPMDAIATLMGGVGGLVVSFAVEAFT